MCIYRASPSHNTLTSRMSVCVSLVSDHVCIYAYMHMDTHTYVFIDFYILMYIHVCVHDGRPSECTTTPRKSVCVSLVCVCVCIPMYVYTCIYAYEYSYLCIYRFLHLCIYMHVYVTGLPHSIRLPLEKLGVSHQYVTLHVYLYTCRYIHTRKNKHKNTHTTHPDRHTHSMRVNTMYTHNTPRQTHTHYACHQYVTLYVYMHIWIWIIYVCVYRFFYMYVHLCIYVYVYITCHPHTSRLLKITGLFCKRAL